jgi:hypothetical protein
MLLVHNINSTLPLRVQALTRSTRLDNSQIGFGKKILLEYYKLPEITTVGIYYGQDYRRNK